MLWRRTSGGRCEFGCLYIQQEGSILLRRIVRGRIHVVIIPMDYPTIEPIRRDTTLHSAIPIIRIERTRDSPVHQLSLTLRSLERQSIKSIANTRHTFTIKPRTPIIPIPRTESYIADNTTATNQVYNNTSLISSTPDQSSPGRPFKVQTQKNNSLHQSKPILLRAKGRK